MARLLRRRFTRRMPRGAVLSDRHASPDLLYLPLAGSVGLQARDNTGAATMVEIGAGTADLPEPSSAIAARAGITDVVDRALLTQVGMHGSTGPAHSVTAR